MQKRFEVGDIKPFDVDLAVSRYAVFLDELLDGDRSDHVPFAEADVVRTHAVQQVRPLDVQARDRQIAGSRVERRFSGRFAHADFLDNDVTDLGELVYE